MSRDFSIFRSLKLKLPIVLLPHPIAVGNAGEEVRFGLMKARRCDRKLLVIFPISIVSSSLLFRRYDPRIFDIDASDFFIRPFSPGLWPARLCFSIYYAFLGFMYKILVRMPLLPAMRLETAIHMKGNINLWEPESIIGKVRSTDILVLDWPHQYSIDLDVQLSSKTKKMGEKALHGIGLLKDDLFVCLHVREGGYYSDAETASPRNSSIENYMPIIEEIIASGRWVFRMGDSSMTKLPNLPGLIDYAHASWKSPRIDAYLINGCSYFIGTQSGILGTAYLFSRPVFLTNMYCPFTALPGTSKDQGIFRHFLDAKTGQEVSPASVFSDKYGPGSSMWDVRGIEYEELTSKELLVAFRKFQQELESLGDQILPSGLTMEFLESYQLWLEKSAASMDTSVIPPWWFRTGMETSMIPPWWFRFAAMGPHFGRSQI